MKAFIEYIVVMGSLVAAVFATSLIFCCLLYCMASCLNRSWVRQIKERLESASEVV